MCFNLQWLALFNTLIQDRTYPSNTKKKVVTPYDLNVEYEISQRTYVHATCIMMLP